MMDESRNWISRKVALMNHVVDYYSNLFAVEEWANLSTICVGVSSLWRKARLENL